MRARFRIRTRDGRELFPGSVEEFARLVRGGGVSIEDLIYDSLTGEWAPAAVHTVYRMVIDDVLDNGPGALAGPPSSEPKADASAPDSFGLSLAPPPADPTPEQVVAAFAAEMEAERRADPDRPEALADLPLVSGGSGIVSDLGGSMGAAPSERRQRSATGSPGAASSRGPSATPSRSRAASTPARVRWLLAATALLTAGVVIPPGVERAVRRKADAPAPDRVGMAGEERVVVPLERLSASEVRTREVADRYFQEEAREHMREVGVGPIPRIWLSGAYLSGAADYPEVRAAWEPYLNFVWDLRAGDARLYRRAYLRALDDVGVVGAVRSLRLAAAMADRAATRPDRERRYGRAEEVATAALSLHDLLVHLTGSITHEPAVGARLSADPVLEAAGRDEGTQRLLESALDRMVEAMKSEDGGSVERAGIPRWVLRTVAPVR
jgi:hypothetical protein